MRLHPTLPWEGTRRVAARVPGTRVHAGHAALPEEAAFNARQDAAKKTANAKQLVRDRRGRRWVLGNQGRVHMLLAAHSMKKIETLYGSVFEGILGERVSTKPVVVATPFPWIRGGESIPQLQGGLRR